MGKRRSYEYAVAYILLAIFIFSIISIELRGIVHDRISLPVALIKNFLVLYIIIFESTNSQKIIRRINFLMLPLAFFGFLFIIQHWPFGHGLFLGSLFLVLTLLFTDAIKSERNKKRLLILTFVFVHYLTVFFSINRLPLRNIMALIELPIAGITASLLLFWLLKDKEKLRHNSGS